MREILKGCLENISALTKVPPGVGFYQFFKWNSKVTNFFSIWVLIFMGVGYPDEIFILDILSGYLKQPKLKKSTNFRNLNKLRSSKIAIVVFLKSINRSESNIKNWLFWRITYTVDTSGVLVSAGLNLCKLLIFFHSIRNH